MIKKAALYARVSTNDQADHGYSLPSQLDTCRTYAERLDYVVVNEFRDDASGATPVSLRPQGQLLMELVKTRKIHAVIVHQVDRLSRDIVDLLTTVRNWLQAGIDVYALDVGKIESELDIVLVIKGWQGSDERKKIRERSMRGKRAKARTGKVIGSRSPYGYKHTYDENGRIENFEIIEEQAKVVRLIYQWYVYGDETGTRLSSNKISKRLSEMGFPTPGEVNKGYHAKHKGGIWRPYGVLSILEAETYAGVWKYGMRIGYSHHKRPKEEWIEVEVPAIIDRKTWEEAQLQRKRNKKLSGGKRKRSYLLSSFLRCSCGCAMTGEYFSNHRYYTCTWRNNHHSGLEERTCFQRSVRGEALEPDIWESIVELFSDQTTLEEHLRIAQEAELSAFDPKQEELNAVIAMIGDTEKEAIEVGRALRYASGIVATKLKQNIDEIDRRYEALVERQAEIEEDLSTTKLTDEAVDDLLQFAEDAFLGIENADFETKRRTLEMLQVVVTIKEKRFYVNSIAGTWEGNIRRLPGSRGVSNPKEMMETDLC
ncbi:MAG: recombinase family protein [Anaerolineae bacterium]|jgi:site-specific DNA recombinase|nr:recombinase family protein [Anaerolineae bacterium]MBT7991247.1 recombinase family protein [Anaerolineae bacterium]